MNLICNGTCRFRSDVGPGLLAMHYVATNLWREIAPYNIAYISARFLFLSLLILKQKRSILHYKYFADVLLESSTH